MSEAHCLYQRMTFHCHHICTAAAAAAVTFCYSRLLFIGGDLAFFSRVTAGRARSRKENP